ncbi:hypothetical protein CRUP_014954 [Coryphaenoides rupestris]|nr:hypothetical protein CRUP_014954 [Coryphaenoides rupestris]
MVVLVEVQVEVVGGGGYEVWHPPAGREEGIPGSLWLLCLAGLWPPARLTTGGHMPNRRRHKEMYLGEETRQKHGGRMKKQDSTKSLLIKSEQLLRIEEHDFAMRPGFGGAAIPVGIDVQVESIDSISEVNMDFTMTLYLRHYWQDHRLAFPSGSNRSRTFDARLVKKIWVPDVFFVHSKRSFIHDTTVENIMLRVYPDGNILYSVRITVTALCSMDFSSFPLDTQNCSLELESYAYNENDLMLYWKNGNDSLRTDEILLSQFFTYFPTMLMVMLSWVSFWIDRRAVPARVSLGITTVLTMSTIITGVSASMPQVSYVKAVDIYLWSSFLFVFLSVIEYAAVNYFTTMEEMKKLRRAKATAFDGCFRGNEQRTWRRSGGRGRPGTANAERTAPSRNSTVDAADTAAAAAAVTQPAKGTRLRRENPVLKNLRLLMSNSYMIDSYSRIVFPVTYLLFNVIYWSLYA